MRPDLHQQEWLDFSDWSGITFEQVEVPAHGGIEPLGAERPWQRVDSVLLWLPRAVLALCLLGVVWMVGQV